MTSISSGAATESLAIDRVTSDGTAFAGLSISYRGMINGRAISIDRSWRAELAPDGEIRSVGARPSLGDALEQGLSYINGLTKGLPSRTLASGATWTAKEPLGSSSGSMIITNKVLGVQTYHGFRAIVIEQNGAGAFTQSVDGSPSVGSIAMGGTLYYDKADHLLIGGAARGETEMALTHADVGHISATTTVNVRLRSWRHGPSTGPAPPSPAASAGSAESAVPSAAPTESPSGAPAPGPTPAYTPATSSTSTPSPISTGN
jgi:hypothetical protein